MRALIAALLLSGCTLVVEPTHSGEVVCPGADDPVDLSDPVDASVLPDLATLPDLCDVADLSTVPDLVESPDLTPAPDLVEPPPDLSAYLGPWAYVGTVTQEYDDGTASPVASKSGTLTFYAEGTDEIRGWMGTPQPPGSGFCSLLYRYTGAGFAFVPQGPCHAGPMTLDWTTGYLQFGGGAMAYGMAGRLAGNGKTGNWTSNGTGAR